MILNLLFLERPERPRANLIKRLGILRGKFGYSETLPAHNALHTNCTRFNYSYDIVSLSAEDPSYQEFNVLDRKCGVEC